LTPTVFRQEESNTKQFFSWGLEVLMSKVLKCNDVVGNCDFEARGESDADVMRQAADHARDVHQISDVSPELADKAQSAIRDEAA
jgi:predicted small metal-binding protein